MTKWHPITCEDCGNDSASRIFRRQGCLYDRGRCHECNGKMRYGTATQLIDTNDQIRTLKQRHEAVKAKRIHDKAQRP